MHETTDEPEAVSPELSCQTKMDTLQRWTTELLCTDSKC